MIMNLKNSRYGEIISLGEGVKEFLETHGIKEKYNEAALLASWEKVMGKTIAGRTVGISIKKRKMTIKVTSAPLRKELSMHKTKILALVAEVLGEDLIEEVIFR